MQPCSFIIIKNLIKILSRSNKKSISHRAYIAAQKVILLPHYEHLIWNFNRKIHSKQRYSSYSYTNIVSLNDLVITNFANKCDQNCMQNYNI